MITKIEQFKENFNFNIEKVKPETFDKLYNLIRDTIYIYGNECDLNFIDTSEITDMSYLFYNHNNFKGDISRWDVSNVIYMQYMFSNSKFDGDISNWDVSNVTNMYAMFRGSKFEGNIDEWNINPNCNMINMCSNSELEKQNKLPKWYKE